MKATIELKLQNVPELLAKIDELAELFRLAHERAPERTEDLFASFEKAFFESGIVVRSNGEPEAAMATGVLSCRVDFSPAVLEILEAVRAIEREGPHGFAVSASKVGPVEARQLEASEIVRLQTNPLGRDA